MNLTGIKNKIAWLLSSSILIVIGLVVWFNFIFYPHYGLSAYKLSQYQEALHRVAEGFAVSESIKLIGLTDSHFHPLVSNKSDAYSWGTAKLLTSNQEEVYVWIGLSWSSWQKSWRRWSVEWLADPRNRAFLASDRSGKFQRLFVSFSNINREFQRRLQEVWPGIRQ